MCAGATEIQRSDAQKHWLQDDQVKPMIGSDQGMYNGYAAIKVNWADTTNMDSKFVRRICVVA